MSAYNRVGACGCNAGAREVCTAWSGVTEGPGAEVAVNLVAKFSADQWPSIRRRFLHASRDLGCRFE